MDDYSGISKPVDDYAGISTPVEAASKPFVGPQQSPKMFDPVGAAQKFADQGPLIDAVVKPFDDKASQYWNKGDYPMAAASTLGEAGAIAAYPFISTIKSITDIFPAATQAVSKKLSEFVNTPFEHQGTDRKPTSMAQDWAGFPFGKEHPQANEVAGDVGSFLGGITGIPSKRVAIGKTLETLGQTGEDIGTQNIKKILHPNKAVINSFEGQDLSEKLDNFAGTIKNENLQGLTNKPEKLSKAATIAGNKHVETADFMLSEASKEGVTIDPISALNKDNISAPVGHFDAYKSALKNITKDLSKLGFTEGQEIPLSEVKKLKQVLREGLNYSQSATPEFDIKKQMITNINKAVMGKAEQSPLIDNVFSNYLAEEKAARDAYNIAGIADLKEFRDLVRKQKPFAPLRTSLEGAAFGVAGEVLGTGSAHNLTIPVLAAAGGLGAKAAYRGLTSPGFAIPVGQKIKRLGQMLQGIVPEELDSYGKPL